MRISTIGGNVAENSGGLRGLKYGVTRDYVMALEVVLADGRIARFGSTCVKDVAGYSMKDLFIGSEGTLGIITEVLLKLVPRPAARRTMLALYDRIEDAAETVSAIIAARIIPCTLEFLDQMTARCVEDYAHVGLPTDCAAVLLMETDGHPAAVADEAERMADDRPRARRAGGAGCARDDAEALALAAARRNAFSALARRRPTTILEDVTVPRSELAEMVAFIAETARGFGLQIGTFGHMGDGNLHPTFLTDERDDDGDAARAPRARRDRHEDARARRHDHRRARRRPGEEGVAAPADGRQQLRADEAGQARHRSGRACSIPGRSSTKPCRRRCAPSTTSVLQQCMHCGMCLPTCPTYDATKRERNSPRGRIALMRAVADGELEVTREFADEMSYCLGCLACQTACPAGVNYAELFETARSDIERAGRQHRLSAEILARRRRCGSSSCILARFARRHGRCGCISAPASRRWCGARVRSGLLPASLRRLEPQTPRMAPSFSNALIAAHEQPAVRRGIGSRCSPAACRISSSPDVNRDTADVLLANGCAVDTPPLQPCCGSLHAHNGDTDVRASWRDG